MPIKRLTPDLSPNVLAATRARDQVVADYERMRSNIETVQNNLEVIIRSGGKADKLDYCVRRLEEIRRALNGLEIASFHEITVRHCCDELWQNLP